MKDEKGKQLTWHGKLSWQETQDIIELVCYNLCMWPSEYKDPDDMQREKCSICPLSEKLDEFIV